MNVGSIKVWIEKLETKWRRSSRHVNAWRTALNTLKIDLYDYNKFNMRLQFRLYGIGQKGARENKFCSSPKVKLRKRTSNQKLQSSLLGPHTVTAQVNVHSFLLFFSQMLYITTFSFVVFSISPIFSPFNWYLCWKFWNSRLQLLLLSFFLPFFPEISDWVNCSKMKSPLWKLRKLGLNKSEPEENWDHLVSVHGDGLTQAAKVHIIDYWFLLGLCS